MKIINRKAHFNYKILEKFEAGIVLESNEVKSLKIGAASINDAYISYKEPHIVIVKMYIGSYQNSELDKERARILLVHKKQKNKLFNYIKQPGMTIIPMEIYWNKRGFAKILCAIAEGKKEYDKRATIKEREHKRNTLRWIR